MIEIRNQQVPHPILAKKSMKPGFVLVCRHRYHAVILNCINVVPLIHFQFLRFYSEISVLLLYFTLVEFACVSAYVCACVCRFFSSLFNGLYFCTFFWVFHLCPVVMCIKYSFCYMLCIYIKHKFCAREKSHSSLMLFFIFIFFLSVNLLSINEIWNSDVKQAKKLPWKEDMMLWKMQPIWDCVCFRKSQQSQIINYYKPVSLFDLIHSFNKKEEEKNHVFE